MDGAKESGSLEFDVRILNEQSNKTKRSKRRTLVAGAIFVVAFGLFFLVTDLGLIANGTLSTLRFVTLLIVLAIVGLILSAIVPGIAMTRSGANLVRLDDSGLELELSPGKNLRIAWSNPALSLELLDFSRVPAEKELTGIRYVIRLGRNETALSREAFDGVLGQARQHGLTVRSSRGSLWIYPAAIAPTVYRVSALSSRSSPNR